MIKSKLIHFDTRAQFDAKLKASEISLRSIVLIKDTGEIWTRGKFYAGTNHNHNGIYLPIDGTAVNSNKLGNINAANYVYGNNSLGMNEVITPEALDGLNRGSFFWRQYATADVDFGSYCSGFHTEYSGANYAAQLALLHNTNEIKFRFKTNKVWQSPIDILTSRNYTSYTVKKDGSGASGTWGINVTGNAATVTNGVYTNTAQNITAKKTFTTQQAFTVAQGTSPFTVTSNTKVDNLNADLIDGLSSLDFAHALGQRSFGTSNDVTTAEFIELLKTAGMFRSSYNVCRGSWHYAGQVKITDTGLGIIGTAGSIIEVVGSTSAYTIRITLPSTSSGGTTNQEYIYVNNGSDYAPGWRRIWNNKNFNPDLKANLASPSFTGTPTAPTAAPKTNTTQIATTAFVRKEVSDLVGGAPETLDTLKEIADYLTNGSIAGGIVEQLGKKVNKTGDTMTGDLSNSKSFITTGDNSGIYIGNDKSFGIIKRGGKDTANFVTSSNNFTFSYQNTAVTPGNLTSAIWTDIVTISHLGVLNAIGGLQVNGSNVWHSGNLVGNQTGHTHNQYYDSNVDRTKNTVLAAPNGSNGKATFRALIAADLPSHGHNIDILYATDKRDVKPNTTGITNTIKAIKPFFTATSTLGISNYGTYADLLVLDTYSDSSGGNPNAIAFMKNTSTCEMFIGKSDFNGTSWGTFNRVWHNGNSGTTAYSWSAKSLTLAGGISGATAIASTATLDINATNDIRLRAGARSLVLTSTYLKPYDVDHNTMSLGTSGARWSTIYGTSLNLNGTISGATTITSSGEIAALKNGRAASFGGTTLGTPNGTIANQTGFIQIMAGTGSASGSSGLIFHNPGISTAGLEYKNTDANNGYFNFKSDDTNWNVRINGNTVWHSANDGSGSGLDADLLDGLHLHTGRNNEANKIVRTDGNGYIQVGYINSSSGNENNNSSPDRVWGSNATDGYLRTYRTSALSVASAVEATKSYDSGTRVDIKVDGASNTYYPVVINSIGSQTIANHFIIYRDYSETAPNDWYSSTHKGSLLLDFEANYGGWGGSSYDIKVNHHRWTYVTPSLCAGLRRGASEQKFVVWLRGGGAVYHILSPTNKLINGHINIYYARTNIHTSSGYEDFVEPITSALGSSNNPGYWNYYRGGALYDRNERVYSPNNTNIGTGATQYAAGNHTHSNFASTITTTGSGNAITALSISGNTITATKGTSFLALTGGTLTGPLEISTGSINNSYNEGLRLTAANNGWVGITYASTGLSGTPTNGWFSARNPSNQFIISPGSSDSTIGLTLNKGGDALWRNSKIWHAGNSNNAETNWTSKNTYVEGDLKVKGTQSEMSSHYYHRLYSGNNVYAHYYPAGSDLNTTTNAHFRISGNGTFKTLYFSGDGSFKWDEKTVWHAGNFDPASKLNVSGGTLTGKLHIGGTNNLSGPWGSNNLTVGADGKDKVVMGYLTSGSNLATIGSHNSSLSNWSTLAITATEIQFRIGSNEILKAKLNNNGLYWGNDIFHNAGNLKLSANDSSAPVNCNDMASNGLRYYTSGGPTGMSTSDGALYSQAYSTVWAGQIAQDYRNGKLAVRGKNNGTWSTWLKFSYEGHTHPYLSLTGGELSGKLAATGSGNDYYTLAYESRGNGSTNTVKPGYGFHQPALYAGSLQMLNATDFIFYKQGGSVRANLYVRQLHADDWLRTTGATGWYSDTYGGGIYMTDSTWVRTYNGKKFYCNNSDTDAIRAEGGIWSVNGFYKSGSNNNYVLLGSGGHKNIGDFGINVSSGVQTGTGNSVNNDQFFAKLQEIGLFARSSSTTRGAWWWAGAMNLETGVGNLNMAGTAVWSVSNSNDSNPYHKTCMFITQASEMFIYSHQEASYSGGWAKVWTSKNLNLQSVQFVRGMIMMWSGSAASVPAGWAICNGANGTPNLTNRFVMGVSGGTATGDVQPGATGGTNSKTLTLNEIPSHGHSVSVQAAGTLSGTTNSYSHSHKPEQTSWGFLGNQRFNAWPYTSGGGGDSNRRCIAKDYEAHFASTSTDSHTHTVSIPSHLHGVSQSNAGGGAAFDNRPAFYAMAFIMKL